MWTTMIRAVLVGATLSLITGAVWAGESVTYKGTGTYILARTLLPLANGDAVMHLAHDTMATIEPSESGFMSGDCAGLAHLTADGEYSSQIFCTFTETEGDSFDLRGRGEGDGGTVEIIGGSGKWSGATGSGTLKRRWAEGNQGTYEYVFRITTP